MCWICHEGKQRKFLCQGAHDLKLNITQVRVKNKQGMEGAGKLIVTRISSYGYAITI